MLETNRQAVVNENAATAGDDGASRTEQAYETLRTAILSGQYPPDTRLTESELTAQLGVSRGTIRAALSRLTHEGYVVSAANRSARTKSFTVEEALEILETREILESALAAKAAERATGEEIEQLAAICQEMEKVQQPGMGEDYSRLNRRFHALIRASARQESLRRFVESLLYPMVMRQYRDLERMHPRAGSLQEHRAILSAIVTHNPEAAAAAMRHHISSARRALALRIEEKSDFGD